MYLILTASKDTYITNKVIDNKFRATDANVGKAGTLDLFKLYNESTLSGDTDVFELSRLLVKFDLDKIRDLCSSSLDLNSSFFKAELKLFDIMSGQANPSNFNVVSYPLSQSFDEGVGRDVASFGDLDVANFITASFTNSSAIGWFLTGANQGGHNDLLAASTTVTSNGAGTTGQSFTLTDALGKSVVFSTDNTVAYDTAIGDAALKTDDTNYKIGILNANPGGGRLAQALYRSVATAKADGTTKLGITAANNDDGSDTTTTLTQDSKGSTGNTTLDLTAVDNLSIPAGTTGFTKGYTPQLDFISSGTLSRPQGDGGPAVLDFGSTQYFKNGNEDLVLDITRVLSGTLDGRIPDNGFRISFSGSEETDNKTRFVKRFGSRNSSNPFKVPQLHLSWCDSIIDHREDFIFDLSGSLFLNNFHRGVPANILSGASANPVEGSNCLLLRLECENYTKYITASQHLEGTQKIGSSGLYSASFAISLSDPSYVNPQQDTLRTLFAKSGSIKFKEYWTSIGKQGACHLKDSEATIGYHTGSLIIKNPQRTSFKFNPSELIFRFTNISREYKKTDIVNLNVFIDDRLKEDKPSKIPYSRKSMALSNVYYRVRERDTGKIIIPFMENNKSTQLSSNSSGMSFKFRMESLPSNRTYVFDLLVTDYGTRRIYEGVSGTFRVI